VFFPACLDDFSKIREAAAKSLFPFLSTQSLALGTPHWLSRQFAEAHLGMHLPYDIAEFWSFLKKVVNLFDLRHNGEGLLAARRTGS
jgi:hypothetical protein